MIELLPLQMGGASVASMYDLVSLMEQHLTRFDRQRHNRAAFLRVYTLMSRGVQSRLTLDQFFDPVWIEQVAIRFAWHYFDAMARFDRGAVPPPAWEYAFTIAERRQGFVLQDVLLGMNAHINNDLPQVVAQILRPEFSTATPVMISRRRFDHDQINRVLELIIPDVEKLIARHDGRLVRPLNRVLGTLDQLLATYGLKSWRDTVWRNALFLLAATSEREQRMVTHCIEADALQIAQQIERVPPMSWFRPLAPLTRRWRLC